jgi:hypothetical protein
MSEKVKSQFQRKWFLPHDFTPETLNGSSHENKNFFEFFLSETFDSSFDILRAHDLIPSGYRKEIELSIAQNVVLTMS